MEIGKRLGAKVIATARGEAKVKTVLDRGANYAIDYKSEGISDRVLEITDGQGADVVLDTVNGDAMDAALNCINWEGRILAVGAASGKIPEVNIFQLLSKNCSVIGVDYAGYTIRNISIVKQALTELMGWYEEGTINPDKPNNMPLDRGAEAFSALANGRLKVNSF